MKNHVLVVGSINADLTIRADRFPSPGETLTGRDFTIGCGGKGENQAVALRKLGCQVRFIGAVGRDPNGAMLRRNLEKNQIGTDSLQTVDGASGAALITVAGSDNTIIVDPGANDKVTPEFLEQCSDDFEWADFVVVQYEISMEAVRKAAGMAHAHGAKFVVNPSPFRKDLMTLAMADILVVNEHEAADLTGGDNSCFGSQVLAFRDLDKKVPLVVETLGTGGCLCRDPQGQGGLGAGVYRQAAFKVDAVDTTGSGDAFLGAFVSCLANDASVPDAVLFATAAAALSVTRPGAASSVPDYDETKAFIAAYLKDHPHEGRAELVYQG